jgi:predicted GNAT family acetyltransferase
MAGFNARLPDMVQVGGVYTPPEARGRGYARTAVALCLRAARERGVRRAILFTGEDNIPAIRAYRALGFERIGDFAIVLLSTR